MSDLLAIILVIILWIWEKVSVLFEKPEILTVLLVTVILHILNRVDQNIKTVQKQIEILKEDMDDIRHSIDDVQNNIQNLSP